MGADGAQIKISVRWVVDLGWCKSHVSFVHTPSLLEVRTPVAFSNLGNKVFCSYHAKQRLKHRH